MKIKNIVQIVTLAGFIATGSAHAMWTNGAKALIRWTGTAIGVGQPLSHSAAQIMNTAYAKNRKIDNQSEQFRDPTETEQQFYSQYITSKNKILKIEKTDAVNLRHHCNETGNHVILPETFGSVSLEEALQTDNQDALSLSIAIAQHHNAHREQLYNEKAALATIITPALTTGAAAGILQKLSPYSKQASLARHFATLCGKSLGGFLLTLGNVTALDQLKHEYECAADQKVSLEHKKDYLQNLQGTDLNLKLHVIALKMLYDVRSNELGELAVGTATKYLKQKDEKRKISNRIERLQQDGTKKA